MELVNSIFHFFTDKTKKLPYKLILLLSTLVLIALLDNFLSFSYSYNNNNKIAQIEGINNILNDTSITKYEREKLLVLRKDILNRSTWKDKSYDVLTSIEFKNDKKSNVNVPEIKGTKNSSQVSKEKPKFIERDYWWHFISSSWLFIILMFVIPVISFLDKETIFWQTIGVIIILEPLLYGICWIYAKVFSIIPIIYNNPFYNYFLNATLCLLSILLFSFFGKKK